jgi:hypothetical protein
MPSGQAPGRRLAAERPGLTLCTSPQGGARPCNTASPATRPYTVDRASPGPSWALHRDTVPLPHPRPRVPSVSRETPGLGARGQLANAYRRGAAMPGSPRPLRSVALAPLTDAVPAGRVNSSSRRSRRDDSRPPPTLSSTQHAGAWLTAPTPPMHRSATSHTEKGRAPPDGRERSAQARGTAGGMAHLPRSHRRRTSASRPTRPVPRLYPSATSRVARVRATPDGPSDPPELPA